MKNNIKYDVVKLLALIIIPALIFISITFAFALSNEAESTNEQNEKYVNSLASEIKKEIEKIQISTDTYSNNKDLKEFIGKQFADDLEKRIAIIRVNNLIFSTYNELYVKTNISAIYNTTTGEIFNFLDPNTSDMDIISKLNELDVNAKDNYGKLVWHGLHDNFLKTTTSGDIREDTVIIGSRRVFEVDKGYTSIHIFALEESFLYDIYKDDLKTLNSDISIFTESGHLVSSSNPEFLIADITFTDALSMDNSDNFVYTNDTIESGFNILMTVEKKAISQNISDLYNVLIVGMLICFSFSGIAIFFLYKNLITPIVSVGKSMSAVSLGNLSERVEPTGNVEINKMIYNYNNMLERIQSDIDEISKFEQTKKRLETEILYNQINPHFLYNTLETIVWKCNLAGVYDGSKMAASLGKLYRLSIARGNFITLSDELLHLSSYMNIQKLRYQNMLDYDVRLKDNIDTMQTKVLKILLQPLAENSIIHAMKPDEKLHIRVIIYKTNDKLKIKVVDNGAGMSKTQLDLIRMKIKNDKNETPSKGGIGLCNIYKRLEIYAGETDNIKIRSKQNIGTIIEITLKINDM